MRAVYLNNNYSNLRFSTGCVLFKSFDGNSFAQEELVERKMSFSSRTIIGIAIVLVGAVVVHLIWSFQDFYPVTLNDDDDDKKKDSKKQESQPHSTNDDQKDISHHTSSLPSQPTTPVKSSVSSTSDTSVFADADENVNQMPLQEILALDITNVDEKLPSSNLKAAVETKVTRKDGDDIFGQKFPKAPPKKEASKLPTLFHESPAVFDSPYNTVKDGDTSVRSLSSTESAATTISIKSAAPEMPSAVPSSKDSEVPTDSSPVNVSMSNISPPNPSTNIKISEPPKMESTQNAPSTKPEGGATKVPSLPHESPAVLDTLSEKETNANLESKNIVPSATTSIKTAAPEVPSVVPQPKAPEAAIISSHLNVSMPKLSPQSSSANVKTSEPPKMATKSEAHESPAVSSAVKEADAKLESKNTVVAAATTAASDKLALSSTPKNDGRDVLSPSNSLTKVTKDKKNEVCDCGVELMDEEEKDSNETTMPDLKTPIIFAHKTEILPMSYEPYHPINLTVSPDGPTQLSAAAIKKHDQKEDTTLLTPFKPILHSMYYAHRHALVIEDLLQNYQFLED